MSIDPGRASTGAPWRRRGLTLATLQRLRARRAGGLGWRRFVPALAGTALLLGFALMAQSWWDSGNTLDVRIQMEDLISAVGGLGLSIVGVVLLVAETRRQDRAREARSIEAMTAALQRLAALEEAASLGAGAPPAAGDSALVVATNASYHRPGCDLAADRPNVEKTTVAAARARGLHACRVCLPEQPR